MRMSQENLNYQNKNTTSLHSKLGRRPEGRRNSRYQFKLLYTRAISIFCASDDNNLRNNPPGNLSNISDPFSISTNKKTCNQVSLLAKNHTGSSINNSYSLIVDGWLADFDLFLIPSPGNGKFSIKLRKTVQCCSAKGNKLSPNQLTRGRT